MIVKVYPGERVAGRGLTTVTAALPAAAMSCRLIAARSSVALTKVVARSTLFQRTTERFVKPEPRTVRVNAAPPAIVEDGERLAISGAVVGVIVTV